MVTEKTTTLVCMQPGEFSFEERSVPPLKENQAIIRIKRIGVCGTDLHAFEGTQPYFSYPRVLGHELAGELVDFDNAPGFQKGEVVTFLPYFHCGECIACRNGLTNCCANLKVCGVHIDGGMTEYFTVPSGSLVHSHGIGLDELALIEPLAIGAHAIRRAMIRKDEFTLVIGAGPIGLGIIEFARIAGGRVIVLDVNEKRLEFCRTQLNVPHVLHASGNVLEEIREITGGDMPSVVIDATGNLNAINNAFQFMSHGGRYVLVGLQKGVINVSHPEFHKREGTLMSSRNATREDFDKVISSIQSRQLNPDTFITHRVQFSQAAKEFNGWLNPASGVIKALICLD